MFKVAVLVIARTGFGVVQGRYRGLRRSLLAGGSKEGEQQSDRYLKVALPWERALKIGQINGIALACLCFKDHPSPPRQIENR